MLQTNQIYNADMFDCMAQIDNCAIDMILCDLPYGITARNTWDNMVDPASLWRQYERIIKPNGAILLFGSGVFTAMMVLSNPTMYRYSLVWKKTTPTGFLNAKKMPLRVHEDIMVFYKKLPTYNPQKTAGRARKVSTAEHKRNSTKSLDYGECGLSTYDSTERYPTSVLEFVTDKQKDAIHPTQKPLDLCRYLIRTYTNPQDVVLDNACGSGTIPLAAKIEGRRCIGIDNGFCEKAGSKYDGLAWASISQERINKYGYCK